MRVLGIANGERVILLLDRANNLAAFSATHDENGHKPTPDTSGGARVNCLNFLRSSGIDAGSYLVEPFDDDGRVVYGFRYE